MSLKGAKFMILYYKWVLDKRCGIQKNSSLDDVYISGDAGVMCVLLVLYITVLEAKNLIS